MTLIHYLDNNATTRTDDRVLEAMLPYFTTDYANSGSSHLAGLIVKEAVEVAQQQVAQLIGARAAGIVFTSGATESVNLALRGLEHNGRRHIVTVTTEHKAVLETCLHLERHGYKVTYLGVDSKGMLNPDDVKEAVTEETLLVCVMLANNETGVIQPVKDIAAIAHARGALFMCDATQAAGKIHINVHAMGIDLMPLSGHKFFGPKGVGALYVSPKAKAVLEPQITGGRQQRNMRSGTLNVPGIVGLGKACEVARELMDEDAIRIGALRDRLEAALLRIEGSYVNGHTSARLYNTTNICFPGINSDHLTAALHDIAVSSGSACAAVTTEPSHVLKAMGMLDADALASIRFSLGRFTTEADILAAIAKVPPLVEKLREH